MCGVTAAIYLASLIPCGGVKTGELWGLGSGSAEEGLYTIDLDTGDATLIHPFDFDPNEGALALGPDGVLYAAFSGEFDELVTIDRHTGEVTVVGTFGFDDVSGLGFSPDGVLYGYDQDADVLITVDVETGAGFEFYDDYACPEWGLYLIDPETGNADKIGLHHPSGDLSMGGLAFVPGPGDGDRDGDVDLDDLAFFQGCLTGPGESEESLPLDQGVS